MEKIVISNEESAIALLDRIIKNPKTIDLSNIKIQGWDDFTIHIHGEKFNNSITPSVMRGIISLQQAIYEAYAIARYQDKNINRLTHEEKSRLELTVVVTQGSSILSIDVNEIASSALEQALANMSSEQVFGLLLFAIVCYFGKTIWVRHIEKAQNDKTAEEETSRQKILADAMIEQTKILSQSNETTIKTLQKFAEIHPQAQQIQDRAYETRNKLIRSLKYADRAEINQSVAITGDAAEFYTTRTMDEWTPIRMDGAYRVLNVNSSNTRQRKVTLRNLSTGNQLTASLEDSNIKKEHLEFLGVAEWNLHPAHLKIKAKMKGDEIKDAQIIDIDKVDRSIIFDDEQDEIEKSPE